LLRRAQVVSFRDEEEAANDEAPPPPSEPARYDVPFIDRRSGSDRRGMDALRAEALKTLISRVEDRNFGGLRNRFQLGRAGLPRIALLCVALLAGGLAAFLALQRQMPVAAAAAVEAPVVVAEPRTRVLVAAEPIAVGQKITTASLGWEEWPQDVVRPEYLTIDQAPDAIESMAGSVARAEILPGEPVRPEKLATATDGSHLSAVLGSGKGAVSVSVTAESASGGFIAPSDRVDVVLTRTVGERQVSDTILDNVRVLAINSDLDAPSSTEDAQAVTPQNFSSTAIATLELDRTQTEVIMTGVTLGRLSLVLRAAADADADDGEAARRAANQAIRISSPFWAK
jgi:pilus assembly protein CpaB